MAKEAVFQGAFTSGELSPHLFDRIDLEVYGAGCAYLRNFVPLPHGPITRRRGSRFVAQASAEARLVPFSFSITQSFVLEMTPGKMRVFYEDGIVLNAAGNAPIEVATPWTASDMPNLNWAQYKDWLYITDGRNEPRIIKRYSNTDWRIETPAWVAKPEQWAGDNWPQFVSFFEQRAVYAGTRNQPQQIWMSMTGLPENFTLQTAGETKDDNALSYTIFSTEANGITFVSVTDSLLVGTAGSEFRVGSTVTREAITPKNINIRPQTFFGSAKIRPIRAGSNTAFISRSRTRLRISEYSLSEEQYVATDLTLYANHILNNRIKEMSVQTAPDTYFWAITEVGELIGCTFEKAQKVLGWHTHTTQGEFKSVCVLPTTGNDLIYVCVKRGTKYFIELFYDLTEPILNPEGVKDAIFMDSTLEYKGEPVMGVVGLSHLEGETVSVLADQGSHPDVKVVNGGITLERASRHVQVGLMYKAEFISLIPQSQQTMTLGMVRRINEAIIALENSLDFYYKAATEDDNQLAYTGPTRIMNLAMPPRSDHINIAIKSKSTRTQQLYIMQDKPFPLTIRGIVYYINPSNI